jgi:NADH dehydrogenase FAD-containing subunit
MAKKLIVIGGGAVGHQVAFEMQDSMDVTLVDPKTYWEVPMALPRLLVEPSALPARMKYSDFLKKVSLVQGSATKMTDSSVSVQVGERLEHFSFDFALIATGSRYSDPLVKAQVPTVTEREREIAQAHDAIRNAKHVVVVGGGPVGVETAAELRETFPHIAVTLVHGAPKLLETGPKKFGAWAAEKLRKLGVNLVLNDIVVEPKLGQQPGPEAVVTKSGKRISADFVLWAAGTKPNTEFVALSWPNLVRQDGQILTDQFLRLKRHPNIFVSGDVTSLPEGRLVITASFHVPAIVKSLKTLADTSPDEKVQLKPYVPKVPGKGLGKLMIVTLGRRDGLTSLPFGQFRLSMLARKMKAEHMFVPKYRKQVGLS